MGEKGEVMKQHKSVLTDPHGDADYSTGSRVAEGHMHDLQTWPVVWGLPEGVEWGLNGGGPFGPTVIA